MVKSRSDQISVTFDLDLWHWEIYFQDCFDLCEGYRVAMQQMC